jgi:hypothetical protein
MGKRIGIILVIILIAGLAIVGYFLYQGRKTFFTDPYKAVAPTASFVIETIDLQSFINSLTTGKGLFGEIDKINEFSSFSSKLKFLAGQVNNSSYKKLMTGNRSVISFHADGTGKLKPLLVMVIPPDVRLRQLRLILSSAGIKTINTTETEGNSILSLPFTIGESSETTYFSIISGLLICTTSEEIMKRAIEQTVSDDDVRNIPGFSRILEASGKNEDKIFIVFSNLPDIIKPLFNTGNLASCASGDIYLNNDGIVLNGYTESLNSADILYKYKTGKVGVVEAHEILPSTTVLFESVFPDVKGPAENNSGHDANAAGLASKLREYTGDEVIKAYIDIEERSVNDNILIIYELSNRVYAEKLLLDEFSGETGIRFFQPDEQLKIPVYEAGYNGLARELVPGFANDFNESWFAFYDKYLITGSSYDAISSLLYNNLLNKTLANDITYIDFENTLPSVAGYYFYCKPSQITDYLNKYLSKKIIDGILSNKASLEKISSLGYQMTSSNNMIYNSLSIRFKEDIKEESTTEWETLLDTVIAIKPFFFTNHITGAKEIFVQDMNNNAYLINAAGRVLWKVPVRERISGSIYMIDYYKNGKYQILFSGKNYLHLLDRNGNYVERFPVELRSPATNSLALFDYDNNLNYRLFVAGEDKMVYAYDKSGNAVRGWKPFRTAGEVNAEISWCRVSGKDYIIVSDNSSIYLLDRRGNVRLRPAEPVTKAANSSLRLIKGSSPSLVCSSPDGTVQHIYFDGSVKKFSTGSFSGNHSFDFFDIDGDGKGEYIFLDEGILYLYDNNRTEMFIRDFGSSQSGGPITFNFSAADRRIGVFDIDNNLIYLIDKRGNDTKGFPLRGASLFSIGKLSDRSGWHLIVGGSDRFLYNYKLDSQN